MGSWDRFVMEGREVEREVARLIVRNFPNDRIHFADVQSDINDHIDFWWLRASNLGNGLYAYCGVDVKGLRSRKRNEAIDESITWLELQAVNGLPGSLRGKASYLAFVCLNETLLVPRKKLLVYAENLVSGKPTVYVNPCRVGIPYSRPGRNDLIVMVPMSDIRGLAEFILPHV